MSSVVALRDPQPTFDARVVAKMTFIRPGRFEAFGDNGRWMHGSFALDAVPAWATRINLHPDTFAALTEMVKPDA